MMNVAVLGYGTVGSGVVEVIKTNKNIIAQRAGQEIGVKSILDLLDFPGDPNQDIIIHDYEEILNDSDVKIVVETMGGVNPAYGFVKRALEAGKSVATSNKELVAKHGAELIKIARENDSNFLFEASVGGGIPVIRPLIESLSPENIIEITGILNGTTNYMLSKMSDEGLEFDAALKRAQEKGYAERNPEADVEGYDACRKIAILTSLAYGKQVDFEDIYTEGITKITDVDIKYAKQLNAAIKLFGKSNKAGDRVYSMVAPFMIDDEHPLMHVNGVFNAILATGNILGDVMFYGKGAGKLPTASAVVSDVVEATKHMGTNLKIVWDSEKIVLGDMNEYTCKFFVRVNNSSENEIRNAFGDVKFVAIDGIDNEIAFVTGMVSEGEFKSKISSFDLINRIRTTF